MADIKPTGGFTFCGVDIADLGLDIGLDIGLEYAPEMQNTYVYGQTVYKQNEQTFEGHDGGYFYGSTAQPKDFVLRCIYQSSHVISSGIMTKINDLFRVGRTGRLVFDRRPWCWYSATVSSVDIRQMTNYQNGVIVINMRAYYPFARQDKTYIEPNDPYLNDLLVNSGMLLNTPLNLAKDFAEETPISGSSTFYVLNPGTQLAKGCIEIAGNVGEGVTITNRTTGQNCKIVALSKSMSTDVSKYLVCDSMSGKVMLTNGTNDTSYAYFYHDNGFIDLAPNYPMNRTLQFQNTDVATNIKVNQDLDESYIGKHFIMKLDHSFADLGVSIVNMFVLNTSEESNAVFVSRIENVFKDGQNNQYITIANSLPETINASAAIVTANEIHIEPQSTMEITKLAFKYRPTFS